MKNTLSKLALALPLLAALPMAAHAQLISFDFTTFDVDADSRAFTGGTEGFLATDTATVDPGTDDSTVQVGTLAANVTQPGRFFYNTVNNVQAGDFDEGFKVDFGGNTSALDDVEWFTFTFQAASGYELDLAGATVNFDMSRPGGGGDADQAIVTSIGGLTLSDAVLTRNGIEAYSGTGTGISPAGSFTLPNTVAYSGLTGPVEFRIYSGDGNGGFEVRSFSVDGTVTAIPEPSTFVLFSGALALGLVILRRRR